MTAGLTLDVVSDVVCPWCWLGKKRLEAAIDQWTDGPVAITWRPFQLDPSVPVGGVPYKDYMRAKFADGGGEDRFRPMREHLEAAAPQAGIRFRFDDIPRRPNTRDAHRLIRWAQGQGHGNAAVEALFRAFFDEVRDIGDPKVLAAVAGEIGLDAAIVADLLASDRDRAEVAEEEMFFRRLGVAGVPVFIANGARAVQGAQEAPVLVELFAAAVQE